MIEQLVEAWQINHRVTIRLLDILSDAALRATLSTRGGRDVARQLAHVHEVRIMRIQGAAKAFASGLPHFEKGESPAKEKLKSSLNASAAVMENVIRQAWDRGGRVAGFRRGVIPLVGYLIAHEAHHRGGILLTLKQSGHSLTDDLRWGLWDWNKI